MSRWKVLESEYLYKQPWLTVRKEKCELPNGRVMDAYYTLEYPTWVSAVAITKDKQVVLVKQYRHGLDVMSIETPGGVVDEGETPEHAIARELREETGYSFENFEYLGKISPNPATTNNYMHMFLATGGELNSSQQLDETEDLEVMFCSISELKQLVKDHKIVQALHTVCIFYALARLGEMDY